MHQQTDHKELLQLIQENQKIIYKICRLYCSNKSDREDLGQEIVYQLIKSYPRFSDTYKFSTWMYRVALNVAISFYRKLKIRQVVTLATVHDNLKDDDDGAGETEHNVDMLQQFIVRLRELDKALMILYLESKSYKEIGEIIGISETNVATKLSRIKEKLKKQFSTINQL